MKLLSSRDIRSALVTGLTTGLIAWRILVFLDRSVFGIAPVWLVPLVPFLWILGVQLGYFLGRWWRPFISFGRFAAIGFTNAAVDFGVLYLGIALTGAASGIGFSVLKGTSFLFATIHSYLWNKYWAFDAGKSGGGVREASAFVVVAGASLVVNVALASVVVALRPVGAEEAVWAGIAAIVGSAGALIFSFAGFRWFVFKKR